MNHYIEDNIYYLVNEQGDILLKITPTDLPNNQIVLETKESVFSGPVDFLKVE